MKRDVLLGDDDAAVSADRGVTPTPKMVTEPSRGEGGKIPLSRQRQEIHQL